MNKKILFVSVLGIILDQLTKFIVSNVLSPLNGKSITVIKNFFYITYVENTGGAWGILGNHTWLLVVISLVFIALLFYYINKENNQSKLLTISYSLLFAGIIGNLIDRIFLGSVRDFFNFYIFSYDFPVFNVADIFIVVATSLLIIEIIGGEINEYNIRKRGK